MGDPIPVIATVGAIIELIQNVIASVDGEKGTRRRTAAGISAGRIGRITSNARRAGPAEKILRPRRGGSRGSAERGTQTENFIDLVLNYRERIAMRIRQCE